MHYVIKDVVVTVAVVRLSARSSNENSITDFVSNDCGSISIFIYGCREYLNESSTEIFKEVGAAEVANF